MFSENKRRGFGRFFIIPLVAGGLALGLGALVYALWNAILPRLLHVNVISYWQAVGLLVLCRILVGGFGRGGGGRHWRGPGVGGRGAAIRERWMQMSEAERAEWKQRWKDRCKR